MRLNSNFGLNLLPSRALSQVDDITKPAVADVRLRITSERNQRFPDDGAFDSSAVSRFTSSPPKSTATIPNDSRCQLIDETDCGSDGGVWRLSDRHLKRDMAAKLLLESQNTPETQRRLELEVRLCGRLQPPEVVPTHELSRLDDARPLITLKLVDGESLSDLLKPEATTPHRKLLDNFFVGPASQWDKLTVDTPSIATRSPAISWRVPLTKFK